MGWVLIVACMGAGGALRAVGFGPQQVQGLNRYVIGVAVPALALVAIPKLELGSDALLAACTPWLIFGIAWPLWTLVGRARGWPGDKIACMVLVTGLGNTAFLGYPLAQSTLGDAALPIAVLIDQLGSFFVFSTLGAFVAGGSGPGWVRLARFPPFLALLFSLVSRGAPPLGAALAWVEPALTPIANTVVPVALVAVGASIPLKRPTRADGIVAVGLGFKMVLAPLLVVGLFSALGRYGLEARVAVLQASMPPMVTASILAQERGLAPELAAKLVAFGIPVAALVVPIITGPWSP